MKRERTGRWTRRLQHTLALLSGTVLMAGCAAHELEVLEPEVEVITDDEFSELDEIIIYDQAEVEIISVPPEDLGQPCPCKCVLDCTVSEDKSDRLAELLGKMKDEANKRAEAATDAVMAVGHDLVEHDEWESMVSGLVELLSSPTLVIVQLPSGTFKKVKLEELSDLDVDFNQIFTIKTQVSAKMKAALAAQMQSHGVPAKDAKILSSHMMDTYLSSL